MEAKVLANKIFKVIKVLEKNEGIALFVSLKKGFEPWLKVELSGLLSNYGKVLPEENRIDIVFNDEWAISLKDKKTEGENVLDNLNELKEAPYTNYDKTCLVFLTFHQYKKKGKDRTKTECDKSITNALEDKNKIYDKDFTYRDFHFNNTKLKINNDGRLWFILG